MNLDKQLYKLNQIGIALSSERDLESLLHKILQEARAFTSAEAGSLYTREGNCLYFIVSQNEILEKRQANKEKSKKKFVFSTEPLEISHSSIAGYVALTGQILNIADAYQLKDAPYQFNPSFDELNHYRTQSMLIVPMKDLAGAIIGVLALINARSEKGEVIPFDPAYESLVLSLASQATVAYINVRLHEKLKNAYLDTVYRLAMAAECREPDIKGHLERISHYAVILAEELGLSAQEIENIRYASLMHDIGKIGISDAILLKPSKLTEQEYEEIKKHTIYGSKILSNSQVEILQISEQIALCHHENYDGTGYPHGLKGEQISLAGRIVTLADVFDALACKRYYKQSWSFSEIATYIQERSGKQFDPQVVSAFLKRLDDFIEVHRKYHEEKE